MLKEQIVNIINDNLKNPIYKTIKLMKLQTILSQSGFVKKEGTPAYIVVLHFVYMLVMNKKISRDHCTTLKAYFVLFLKVFFINHHLKFYFNLNSN